MFKKISLILALVLVIEALLLGCADAGHAALTPMTEEWKDKIDRAWILKNWSLQWGPEDDVYYGKYEGYEIFLITAKVDQREEKVIAGKLFTHEDHPFGFYCYRDGKIQGLLGLYREGLISEETVTALAKINAGETKLPRQLSKARKKEIEDAWLAPYFENIDEYRWRWGEEENGGHCHYYGTYEDYDILFYQGQMTMAVLDEKTIAGEIFRTGSSPFDLFAYRDGVLYDLETLYEDGGVSAETVKEAAKLHREWISTLYD